MRQYFYHPESESTMVLDSPWEGDDGHVEELTREEFVDILTRRWREKGGPYRVVVFGGRDFCDQSLLEEMLDHFHANHGIAVLIEGEAPGADVRAKAWAKSRNVPFEPYPADWTDLSHADARVKARRDGSLYDAAAGGRRNQRMIDEGKADCGIAFKGGVGTADMKSRCEMAGVLVFEVKSDAAA